MSLANYAFTAQCGVGDEFTTKVGYFVASENGASMGWSDPVANLFSGLDCNPYVYLHSNGHVVLFSDGQGGYGGPNQILSSLGPAENDVCNTIGTYWQDAELHETARLLAVKTRIYEGRPQDDILYVTKMGAFAPRGLVGRVSSDVVVVPVEAPVIDLSLGSVFTVDATASSGSIVLPPAVNGRPGQRFSVYFRGPWNIPAPPPPAVIPDSAYWRRPAADAPSFPVGGTELLTSDVMDCEVMPSGTTARIISIARSVP
jgi:hypothetical protein